MKIAIVADDYKVDKFVEKLDAKKYTYTTQPYLKNSTLITVECDETEIKTVAQICREIETICQRRN